MNSGDASGSLEQILHRKNGDSMVDGSFDDRMHLLVGHILALLFRPHIHSGQLTIYLAVSFSVYT